MSVKKDERMVKSKKNKDKLVKKITYKCEGSYVDANGNNKRYHKRGFATAEEAKEWERVFLLESTTGVTSNMTVNDLYVKFMDQKKLVVKERSFYEIDKLFNKHILPTFKDMKLSQINMEKIENYQQELLNFKKENGDFMSNNTLDKIQTNFKSLLQFGCNKGYIKDIRIASFKNIKRANERKKEMDFWQPSEFDKFIVSVDDVIYAALFNVLYWCGLRLGEALALTWNDIDFNKKTITINKSYTKFKHQITSPKTQNSYRTVIMPNKCLESVNDLFNEQKDIIGFNKNRLLFYFDKPLDENTLRRKKDAYCDIAKVNRIRIHDLRHSHVSLLINLGFNPFDISKRLGHTVEMVNNVYGHWFQDAQNKMVDKLNNM